MPHWISRIAVERVAYRPLVDQQGLQVRELPLAAAWVAGTQDPLRAKLMQLVTENLARYAA